MQASQAHPARHHALFSQDKLPDTLDVAHADGLEQISVRIQRNAIFEECCIVVRRNHDDGQLAVVLPNQLEKLNA